MIQSAKNFFGTGIPFKDIFLARAVVTRCYFFVCENGVFLFCRWSVMVCVALKDIQRDFVLHGFSQPIPLPTECVTYAYNRTVQNVDVEFLGYDIPIEEAVKMHIPFTKEQDWCSVLSGNTCSF